MFNSTIAAQFENKALFVGHLFVGLLGHYNPGLPLFQDRTDITEFIIIIPVPWCLHTNNSHKIARNKWKHFILDH